MSSIYHQQCEKGLMGKYAKVAHRLPPQSSILEIGCNTGYFSRVLMGYGHNVLGIEKDEDTVKIARHEGIPVVCGDIENPEVIPSIEMKFDFVLLMDILEHLKDPADVLKRLKSVLNKNGRIVVTGPNVAYWAVRKALLFGRWNYSDSGILDRTHLHFFTASAWCFLIEEAGYEIISFEPAEGMIPFEHIFSKVPVIRPLVPVLRRMALRLWSELFSIVFLIEAIPAYEDLRVLRV